MGQTHTAMFVGHVMRNNIDRISANVKRTENSRRIRTSKSAQKKLNSAV